MHKERLVVQVRKGYKVSLELKARQGRLEQRGNKGQQERQDSKDQREQQEQLA